MTDSEWARTSIKVWHGSAAPRLRDIVGGTLEDQLKTAEGWLSEVADAWPEGELNELEARLFCSWAPSRDQRAMTLPSGLVRALARVNGTYWMDFYPPER